MGQDAPIPVGLTGLDRLLVRLGTQPHEQDWTELVRSMARPVQTVALRICGDAALAEDISQETFLAVAKALPRYHSQGDVQAKAWIMRIAANRAISIAGRQPRHQQLLAEADQAASPEVPPSSELLEAVRTEIRDLPDRYRMAIVLRFLDGRNYGEIASVLAWTEVRARKAVERGLDLLRSRLVRRGVPATMALCAAWCSRVGAAEPATPLALVGALARRPVTTTWPVSGVVLVSAIVTVLATAAVATFAGAFPVNPGATPNAVATTSSALSRFIGTFLADHPDAGRRQAHERLEARNWQLEGPWNPLSDGVAAFNLPASQDWTEARLVLEVPLDLSQGDAGLLAIRCDRPPQDGRFAIGLAGFSGQQPLVVYQLGRGDGANRQAFDPITNDLVMAIRLDRDGARILVGERGDLPSQTLANLGSNVNRTRLGILVAARGGAVTGQIQVVQVLTTP